MNTKFRNFLESIKSKNPALIESIKKAYKICMESDEMTQEEPKIRISYETWDEDSIDVGETNDRGWEDEAGVSMQPDQYDIEEGLTPVDLAVKFLTDNGPLQASSSSFDPRVWYTHYGEMQTDGTTTNRSFHLVGFSPEQLQEIYDRV